MLMGAELERAGVMDFVLRSAVAYATLSYCQLRAG